MSARDAPGRRPELQFAVPLAAGLLVAALPWFRAYSSTAAMVALVVAAVAPVLLAALCARVLWLGVPAGFAISATALAVTLYAAAGFSFAALASGLVHGPGRLLTETLPLAGSAQAAPAVVVVWIAAAAAGELALRPPATSHLTGATLAVPVVSFVLALALTAPAPGSDWAYGPLALLALSAAAAGRFRWRERSSEAVVTDAAAGGSVRRPVTAVGLVVLLAAVLAAAVPQLPGIGERRASVYEAPPTSASLLADPVATFGAIRDAGPTHAAPLLRVVTHGATDGYLTVAVLDDFDGSEWTFDSTFDPSGGRVPTPAGYVGAGLDSSQVSATVTLLGRLPVPMLPVFERPSRVEGVQIAADAEHGMVVPDQRIRLPARYTMAVAAPNLTLAGVPGVDGIGSAVGRADLALPPDSADAVAAAARFVASIAGIRPTPTVAFLQQAIAALRRNTRRVVPAGGASPGAALGGTSLSAVINAVTVKRAATPEQFATFFALVARYLGVPARIATGFRLQVGPGGAELPAGSYAVSGRQAWTWVELPLAGMGWVVADPTPLLTAVAGAPPPEQVQASPTTLPAPRANAVPRNQAGGGHAIARPVTVRGHRHSGSPGWVYVVAVVASVALVAAVGTGSPVMVRRRRARRRYSADPALLAAGAWNEMIDALSRAGMEVPDWWTSSEVAAEAGRHFGPEVPLRVSQVGRLADRAMCSPSNPPDRESALAAWELQRDLARDIRRGLDRRQRARALVAVTARRGNSSW